MAENDYTCLITMSYTKVQVQVQECDPSLLDDVTIPMNATQTGRLLGMESDTAHTIIQELTGIKVHPVVRFYTTLWGRVAPHKDSPSFNAVNAARTLIIYLSDCKGGDLFFETGDSVRTGRGVVVVFDKSLTHWTDPVVEGAKKCVVCDVYSSNTEIDQ